MYWKSDKSKATRRFGAGVELHHSRLLVPPEHHTYWHDLCGPPRSVHVLSARKPSPQACNNQGICRDGGLQPHQAHELFQIFIAGCFTGPVGENTCYDKQDYG